MKINEGILSNSGAVTGSILEMNLAGLFNQTGRRCGKRKLSRAVTDAH
ncbi:MAG: hypothetical protein LAO31_12255 [Acidobacteriia bacterium]|nr:hypothetical protein [Terriglobia bacterium]